MPQDYIEQMYQNSKERIPQLLNDIRALTSKVDPLELLSQLMLTDFFGCSKSYPNADKMGEDLVKMELLSWVLLQRSFPKGKLKIVDGELLNPLENALKEYRTEYSRFLLSRPPSSDVDHPLHHIQNQLQSESAFVRGEGLWEDIESFAKGIYRPHSDWMISKYGFTIDQAFEIVNAIIRIMEERFEERRQKCIQIEHSAREKYIRLLESKDTKLPQRIMAFRKRLLEIGVDDAINRLRVFHLFQNSKDILGVTLEDLADSPFIQVDRHVIERFLSLMSCKFESVNGDPDPLKLHPLVVKPLIVHEMRYYAVIPNLLCESLLNRFYYDAINDQEYKDIFNVIRSDWLENQAIEAFKQILPDAHTEWKLKYGPANEFEIDGVIQYDNKLILLEAKWKFLTISARQGNLLQAESDIENAIAVPYNQAKRAEKHIHASDEATFVRPDGSTFTIKKADFPFTYIVTILGKGSAIADLAVNIHRLRSLECFKDADYPWAIPLTDLRVVAEFLESPSQLFDYMNRRDRIMQDGRFLFHDEWDVLGCYLKGYLDPLDEKFQGQNLVFLAGCDIEIDHYKRFLHDPNRPPVIKPRRNVPPHVTNLINLAESTSTQGRTNWTVALLSFPDEILHKYDQLVNAVCQRTYNDKEIHGGVFVEQKLGCGFVFMSSCNHEGELSKEIEKICLRTRAKSNIFLWLGAAIDIACKENWFALYLDFEEKAS